MNGSALRLRRIRPRLVPIGVLVRLLALWCNPMAASRPSHALSLSKGHRNGMRICGADFDAAKICPTYTPLLSNFPANFKYVTNYYDN